MLKMVDICSNTFGAWLQVFRLQVLRLTNSAPLFFAGFPLLCFQWPFFKVPGPIKTLLTNLY